MLDGLVRNVGLGWAIALTGFIILSGVAILVIIVASIVEMVHYEPQCGD